MNENTVGRVHWSFWAIGAVALIFNVMGCINFLSQMNAEGVAALPQQYRAIVEARPAWATVVFAIAVFGGALGGILLLLRKSAAFYVFVASLFGAVTAQIPFLGTTGFPVEALIGGLIQVLVTVFLIWYAKRAERKGWIT
jgi:hypothetical protein